MIGFARRCEEEDRPITVVADHVAEVVATLVRHHLSQNVPQYIFPVIAVFWELQAVEFDVILFLRGSQLSGAKLNQKGFLKSLKSSVPILRHYQQLMKCFQGS